MAKNASGSKPWVKTRHKVIKPIVKWIFSFMCKFIYGAEVDTLTKEQNERQYIILSNHQTAYDQFFLGLAFKKPVYYVANEDLFTMGFTSRLIEFLVGMIPFQKSLTDPKGVRICLKVAREGGTIGIFPEGGRTYSGHTEKIRYATVKLVKHLKLPLALFNIEGGYGVQPRWSDVIRKSYMHAGVKKIIEPEEYLQWTNDELYDAICDGLYVDEDKIEGHYPHEKSAEYLERVFYVCPHCGMTEFESNGKVITCKSCGRQAEYTPEKKFKDIGEGFGFETVSQWYDYQISYIRRLNIDDLKDEPVFEDTAELLKIIYFKRRETMDNNAHLKLYGDRIDVKAEGFTRVLKFDDIAAMSNIGKNKIEFYLGDQQYQFKADGGFNGLKYVHFYYNYLHAQEGRQKDGEFLGL